MHLFYESMVDSGYTRNTAFLITFIVLTPIMILFAWLLEIVIDAPAKKFSHDLENACRIDRDDITDKNKEDDKDRCCCDLVWKTSKVKIIAFISWFVCVYIVVTLYIALRKEP
jgi:hypothetical protein